MSGQPSALLFLSYSHQDTKEANQLVGQLKVLELGNRISVWSDQQIPAGDDWLKAIDDVISQAVVALLFVTADFLTSDFIQRTEIPALFDQHRQRGLQLFPIIAKPCAWQEVKWLARLNLRPRDGIPIWRAGKRSIEQQLAEIAREVAGVVRDRTASQERADTTLSRFEFELRRMMPSGRPVDLSQVGEALDLAIAHGAKIYNQGDAFRCAEIYRHTASSLVDQLQKVMQVMKGSGTSSPKGASMMDVFPAGNLMPLKVSQEEIARFENQAVAMKVVGMELQQVLEGSPDLTHANATRIAWELRYSFDVVAILLSCLWSLDEIFGSRGSLSSSKIRDAIRQTRDHGTRIYNHAYRRQITELRAIRLVAAAYLHAARKLLPHLPDEARLLLEPLVAGTRGVTDENAWRIAWNVQHAFGQF